MLPDEIDQLILQLAASIPPPEYDNFITAAYTVLTGIDCNQLGPGLAYRRLRDLQTITRLTHPVAMSHVTIALVIPS